MLLEENQIAFHSDDGLIVDGVKDYSHQIAEMIGLTSDSEFRHAGVSTMFAQHQSTLLLCFFCRNGSNIWEAAYCCQDKSVSFSFFIDIASP